MSEKQVYKHAEGKGSLFKNNYKEKDNHPDMTGSCTDPNGVVWELAGWKSTTQGGDVYLSISIEKPFVKTNPTPQAQPQAQPQAKGTSGAGTSLDLDLPDF